MELVKGGNWDNCNSINNKIQLIKPINSWAYEGSLNYSIHFCIWLKFPIVNNNNCISAEGLAMMFHHWKIPLCFPE